MGEIESFHDLQVWQRGMDLAVEVYSTTQDFPKSELFGLTFQLRKASSSVPANIAEGWGRNGPKEFLHFLNIAMGSLREVETHLILSQRVGLITRDQLLPLQESIQILGRQISSLQRQIRRKLEAA